VGRDEAHGRDLSPPQPVTTSSRTPPTSLYGTLADLMERSSPRLSAPWTPIPSRSRVAREPVQRIQDYADNADHTAVALFAAKAGRTGRTRRVATGHGELPRIRQRGLARTA